MLAHHLSRMFQKDFCSRKWCNRMMQWMNFRALLKLFQICGYSLRGKINYTEKTTAQSSQLPCLLTSAYSLQWQGWAGFFTRAGLCCHEAICPCSASRTAWVAMESKGFSYLSILPFIHSFMAQFCEGWSRTAFERAMIKCFFFFFFSGRLIPGWNFRLGCSILDNPCGNAPVRWGSQWSTVTAPSQARPLLGTVGVQRSGVDGCFQNRGHPCWTGSEEPESPSYSNHQKSACYLCMCERGCWRQGDETLPSLICVNTKRLSRRSI